MIPTAQELSKLTYSQMDLYSSKLRSVAEDFVDSKFLNTKLINTAADRHFSCYIDLRHYDNDKAPEAINFIIELLEEKGYQVHRSDGKFVIHINWRTEREVK